MSGLSEFCLTGARVMTPQGVSDRHLTVCGGKIERLGGGAVRQEVNCGGDYIIPGLIELHTDNLESSFQPRPGVIWPSQMLALHAHDAALISSGITTVLDAISCGQLNEAKQRHQMLDMSVAAIREGRAKDLLRADHLLHLRCEVCDPCVMEMFQPYVDEPNLQLVSLMDHTPGQRQFCNLDRYKQYYRLEKMDAEAFAGIVNELEAVQNKYADKFRETIICLCKARNIPMASHDDTTPAHVDQARAEGLVLSEFPTTIEAAMRARALGMGIIMGAPNVVRNGSHSGNVPARMLAEAGLIDILSSDYVPVSLLHGAWLLHRAVGLPEPDAFATVTANPARFLGLDDRGTIEEGKNADLVRVSIIDGEPVVRMVWRNGRIVF